MELNGDGEATCSHCHRLYNPRLNFGSWECRRHPQLYDPIARRFPCCGIISAEEWASRVVDRVRIVGARATVFIPGMVQVTQDDWLGCCRADHDLPPLKANEPWPPHHAIRIHLLASQGANPQAIDWTHVLRTRDDYVGYEKVPADEAPSIAEFDEGIRLPAVINTVTDPAFYTYMANRLSLIRTGRGHEATIMAVFDQRHVASDLLEALSAALDRHRIRDTFVLADGMLRLTLRSLTIQIVQLLVDYRAAAAGHAYWLKMAKCVEAVRDLAERSSPTLGIRDAVRASLIDFGKAVLPLIQSIPAVPVRRANPKQEPETVMHGRTMAHT